MKTGTVIRATVLAALTSACGLHDSWRAAEPVSSFNASLGVAALSDAAAGDDADWQAAMAACSECVPEFAGHSHDLRHVVQTLDRLQPLLADPWDGEIHTRQSDGAHRVEGRHEVESFWSTLDLFSPITLPLAAVGTLLWLIPMEDTESLFDGRSYDTFVVMDETDTQVLGVDDEFQVVVRYLGVENFTEGRLRDSLGGNGGELSLQVSINALTDEGQPMADDLRFLLEEQVKRRLPILTILEGTDRGKNYVERLRQELSDAQTTLQSLPDGSDLKAELKQRLGQAQQNGVDALAAALDTLTAELDAKLAATVTAGSEAQRVGSAYIQLLRDELTARFDDVVKGKLSVDILVDRLVANGGAGVALLDSYDAARDILEGQLATFVVDDESILEQVTVIKGLADADRLTNIEYDGIRPHALRGYSSAASRFPYSDDDRLATTGAADRIAQGGLVYQGSLRELSDLGVAQGFALSTLLLERDDDRLVRALDLVEQYALEKDLQVDLVGAEVSGAALADALGQVAETIADDDIELKSIDLRFLASALPGGAGPGRQIFTLAPCSVVVARNFSGAEWDALTIVQIRRAP